MTRTKDTEKKYILLAERLQRKFYKDTGMSIFSEPFAFIEWLEKSFEMLKPASIRQYKAAMIFYLENQNAPKDITEEVKNLIATNKNELPERTSSKKRKKVEKATLNKVIKRLLKRDSLYTKFTILFLVTNIYFGFRPHEWESAKYDEENNSIIIKNGKNSNGRANGDSRSISFSKDEAIMKNAKALIEEISILLQECETWEKLYSGARKLLYSVQQDLEEKISFYDTRHQTAANMKASGLSREDIASIMGHKSIMTASLHYAKKNTGKKLKNHEIPRFVADKILKQVIGNYDG